jgi:hypothetical protein
MSKSEIDKIKDYYNLTDQEKQLCADNLNYIFKGTIGYVTQDQVTPAVAKASDFLIKEVFSCSTVAKSWLKDVLNSQLGNMATVIIDDIFHITDRYPVSGKSIVKELIALEIIKNCVIGTILGIIINKLLENRNFSPCVNAVNVRWKSQMGLLLYGVIDELPY